MACDAAAPEQIRWIISYRSCIALSIYLCKYMFIYVFIFMFIFIAIVFDTNRHTLCDVFENLYSTVCRLFSPPCHPSCTPRLSILVRFHLQQQRFFLFGSFCWHGVPHSIEPHQELENDLASMRSWSQHMFSHVVCLFGRVYVSCWSFCDPLVPL